MRSWLLALNLIFFSPVGLAASLPSFTSSFKVITFGTVLGHSHQTLKCNPAGQCTLTAVAKPEGIARLFTNEWLWEQSQFVIKKDTLLWQRYQKKKYEDNHLKKQVTLVRNPDKVVFQEGPKTFPLNTPVYDALCLPLAIALMQQQKHFPETLYLQDNNWQDRLHFVKTAAPDELDGQATLRFELNGQHIQATLHLLNQAPYLPYSIDIYNKQQKRHIILILDKTYHYATQ